jgi:hypothetical protein
MGIVAGFPHAVGLSAEVDALAIGIIPYLHLRFRILRAGEPREEPTCHSGMGEAIKPTRN